jgi:hypothetical protein
VLLVLLAGVGVFAIVAVQPDLYFPQTLRAGPRANPEVLKRHVHVISTEIAPRDCEHPENLAKAAAYISDRLAEQGYIPRNQEFKADGKPYKNVSATFWPPGMEPETPVIVVGAHYDSYNELPAADDNASGVAGLLELARLIKEKPPRFPVELVAFANEEPPYFQTAGMGSLVHARSLKQGNVEVLAMFSLEMIGYFTDQSWSQDFPFPLLRLFYPSTGNFIAVVGDLNNRRLAREVRNSMRSAMRVPVYSISAPAAIPGIDFSDQWSYWTQGYPGVMITDTSFYRNKAYHTAGDKPDRLDYERMADVVSGVYQAVADLNPH